MIIGIGTDIVDIERIKSLYQKSGEKFINRVLSEEEKQQSTDMKQKSNDRFYSFLAKRFAAKEAVAKALGTGIGEAAKFSEISITNDSKGKPEVKLSASAKASLQKLTPDNQAIQIDISLSDEKHIAIAVVVISATSSPRTTQLRSP